MEAEDARRKYRRSNVRAAAWILPILVLAPLPALIGRLNLTEDGPPGWYILSLIASAGMVFAAAIAFILLRRCPACAGRAPVDKRSGGCCRYCGVRLV